MTDQTIRVYAGPNGLSSSMPKITRQKVVHKQEPFLQSFYQQRFNIPFNSTVDESTERFPNSELHNNRNTIEPSVSMLAKPLSRELTKRKKMMKILQSNLYVPVNNTETIVTEESRTHYINQKTRKSYLTPYDKYDSSARKLRNPHISHFDRVDRA